ncbi:MAG: hypothetical protein ACRELV_17465 [Longimicrobiales bacterium]
MIETLLILFVVGVLGLVVIGIVFALLGAITHLAAGLLGFIIFKLLPILLLGWLILHFLAPRKPRDTSDF